MSLFTRLSERYRQAHDPLRTERSLELAALVCTLLLLIGIIVLALRLAFLSEPGSRLPSPGSLEGASAAVGDPVTADM